MKTYSLTFDGSGTDEKVLPQGTYLRILETSAAISIVAEESGRVIADLQSVQQGLAWESEDKDQNLVPFTRARVTSLIAQTVKLAVGYGRVLNDATSGNVTATVVKGTTLVVSKVTVGAVSGVLLAANTARRRVRFKNTHATDTFYFRDDGGAATVNDYPVGPGEETLIETTDGFNAIRGGANDVDVRILEERD